ncbi:MAG: bifunctional nuclease family protein [Candidatus Eisenbacteria bacterium]|uniref:Bifunctional nuclease family protein n=2 Tax=Eiseniibacteriota bacterium TaxID=2212470 RepID=A0A538SHL2_UNCEI|nr:MAG: bifunctional nuclease family protein [Candidatus Eisenbacteria bacterium]
MARDPGGRENRNRPAEVRGRGEADPDQSGEPADGALPGRSREFAQERVRSDRLRGFAAESDGPGAQARGPVRARAGHRQSARASRPLPEGGPRLSRGQIRGAGGVHDRIHVRRGAEGLSGGARRVPELHREVSPVRPGRVGEMDDGEHGARRPAALRRHSGYAPSQAIRLPARRVGFTAMSMIPVRVGGLAIDERTKSPVVLLHEIEGNRVLPIWIGPMEASAIHMEILGKKYPRPLTHDLMIHMLESLNAKVSRVVITDLKDSTFFANIYVDGGSGAVPVDARPSDSIAIALRARAPIFIMDKLFEKSAAENITPPKLERTAEEKAEELRRYLEGLNPEDFGKFNPEEL